MFPDLHLVCDLRKCIAQTNWLNVVLNGTVGNVKPSEDYSNWRFPETSQQLSAPIPPH